MKFDYAAKETFQNLRRNLLLTTASMLTVAVSLSMVGVAFLLRYGVDNATERWQNGIEFEVFLNPEVTPEQTQRIERELTGSPDVRSIRFISQAEQHDLFERFFDDEPAFLENVDPENLPPSFRVEPSVEDADVIQSVGNRFTGEPGVREVVFAFDTVDTVIRLTSALQLGMLIVAGVLLFAAALLIFNTIRMAIFARRREIEVMKLVGATNWFIRVPFMIEGLIQGVVGAGTAFGIVYVLRNIAEERISNFELFQGFIILTGQVTFTGILLVAIGSGIGAIGAGVAVSRFLDV